VLAPVADLDDAALMSLVQADDSEAFKALFDRFAARAYRVAYAIARDRNRAQDVVQDAFLAIWRTRATYQTERGTVCAWTLGIVRHRAIDSLRRELRHETRRAGQDHLDESIRSAHCVGDAIAEREQAARLRACMARLPPSQREVIALAYFGELTSTEIAGELSLPLGTVKGRKRLGLDKLRSAMPG
jgi:RNA polymerase sigma-70 factor, ECF subfamily